MRYSDQRGVRTAAVGIEGLAERSGCEAVTGDSPLELLQEAEARREGLERLREVFRGVESGDMGEVGVWLGEFGRLKGEEGQDDFLRWVFADGYHPGKTMMRLYAAAMVRNPELVAGMSQSDFAAMVGRGRAAISARMKLLFPGKHLKAGKGEEAKRRMADRARGNGNRVNGAKKKI
jgi:hypothetical protein